MCLLSSHAPHVRVVADVLQVADANVHSFSAWLEGRVARAVTCRLEYCLG